MKAPELGMLITKVHFICFDLVFAARRHVEWEISLLTTHSAVSAKNQNITADSPLAENMHYH